MAERDHMAVDLGWRLIRWGAWAAGFYVFWRWCAGYLMPFLLALFMAAALEPFVGWLTARGMQRAAASFTALAAGISVAVTGVGVIATLLLSELLELSKHLPDYWKRGQHDVDRILSEWFRLREELGLKPNSFNAELHSLYRLFHGSVNALVSLLIHLPDVALVWVVAAVAAFFLLRDRERMRCWLRAGVPPQVRGFLVATYDAVMAGIFGFVRAELTLVAITASTTTVALLLVGAPYAIVAGLSAGLLDFVPFLGPSALLVPWATWFLIVGPTRLGVLILLVWLTVVLLRQSIEPRLLGNGTGLHPLVVLFSLYVGVKMFGATGFLIGPITAVATRSVMQAFAAQSRQG
jgi:sporulation integral membrane protein YtvI